ncbi:MAG: hypothetical protein GY866_41095 [Proteobacteria bacterium]|nr:hypothetical protein [Pseudomonadota bacterium]
MPSYFYAIPKRAAVLFLCVLILPIHALAQSGNDSLRRTETRYVRSNAIKVYEKPDKKSRIVGEVRYLEQITIIKGKTGSRKAGIWLKVLFPLEGYIYQKRLIRKPVEDKSKDTPYRSRFQSPKKEMVAKPPKSKTASPEAADRARSDFWFGGGFGLYVIPEESGYSSSMGSDLEFFLEYTDKKSILSKFRFGINMTEAKKGSTKTSTSSIFGAYKYPIKQIKVKKTELYALGGLELMQSSASGNVSGSSLGFGLLAGVGGFYDFDLPDSLKVGGQFVIFSGEADFGGGKKYVGSNQLQIIVMYHY